MSLSVHLVRAMFYNVLDVLNWTNLRTLLEFPRRDETRGSRDRCRERSIYFFETVQIAEAIFHLLRRRARLFVGRLGFFADARH